MADGQHCTSLLACPVCARPLARDGGGARCEEGHSFDFARSGYLNLAGGGRGGGRVGDTAEMARARAEFLAGGHYRPLAAALVETAPAAEVVAELGCGTAYYLAALVDGLRERGAPPRCGFGFDLSKAAAAQAARHNPGLTVAVTDVETRIPLGDGAADLALSVFAPRPAAELGRVIRPGGTVLAAFATPRHLAELRDRLGLLEVGEAKLERLAERLTGDFELTETDTVEFELNLSAEQVRLLVAMGPNARHGIDAAALPADEHVDLASVAIARFRRS